MNRMYKKLFILILCVSFMHIECGYFLYPEREGTRNGRIDPEILILDCAWLLAGVIPGIIALFIDFHTGCIYETGKKIKGRRGQRISVRMRGTPFYDGELEGIVFSSKGNSIKVFQKEYKKEERMSDFYFSFPEEISGEFIFELRNKGETVASWIVEVE